MAWYYREFFGFPKSQPRAAKGGIKAQSQRGQFGKTWWAKRWLEVLDRFDLGARLSRGRSYARRGQVLNIDVTDGKVKAKVQGSRPQPYNVTIAVKPLTPAEWKRVVKALGGQAVFAAKLLAGEMPQDIEKVFADVDLSLFPEKAKDLTTDCSCPDWSNPCKHVAAVYYLLGEEFDRDPFLLFRLRGMERDELLRQLGDVAGKPEGEPAAPAETPEPLPSDPMAFWAAAKVPEEVYGAVEAPRVTAAWLRRLGAFPFWRGAQPLAEALEPVYRPAAERGVAVFLGEPGRDAG
jgi:uncharacterized Zn finger protein